MVPKVKVPGSSYTITAHHVVYSLYGIYPWVPHPYSKYQQIRWGESVDTGITKWNVLYRCHCQVKPRLNSGQHYQKRHCCFCFFSRNWSHSLAGNLYDNNETVLAVGCPDWDQLAEQYKDSILRKSESVRLKGWQIVFFRRTGIVWYQMTDSERPRRINGLSPPYTAAQLSTWVFLPTLVLEFLFFASPLLPLAASIACSLIFFFSAAASTYFALKAMKTDPADPRICSRSETGDGHDGACAWDPNEPTKQCWICDVQVGEKSMHCKFCNKCVGHFDHHCMCKFSCHFLVCVSYASLIVFTMSFSRLTFLRAQHVRREGQLYILLPNHGVYYNHAHCSFWCSAGFGAGYLSRQWHVQDQIRRLVSSRCDNCSGCRNVCVSPTRFHRIIVDSSTALVPYSIEKRGSDDLSIYCTR